MGAGHYKNAIGSLLYFCNQLLESFWFVQSEVSKHLAVELDALLGKLVHEYGIAQAFRTYCSINAYNPQAAVVALLQLTAYIFVTEAFLKDVLGYGVNVLTLAIKALGLVKYFFPSCAGGDRIYRTWHILKIKRIRNEKFYAAGLPAQTEHLLNEAHVAWMYKSSLTQVALALV